MRLVVTVVQTAQGFRYDVTGKGEGFAPSLTEAAEVIGKVVASAVREGPFDVVHHNG